MLNVDWLIAKELLQTTGKFLKLTCLTLPDHERLPTCLLESDEMVGVAPAVVRQLLSPIFRIRRRHRRSLAIGMVMPKASVNKNHLSFTGEHNIWFAREPFEMNSVSET
jgi:hypothetical protein